MVIISTDLKDCVEAEISYAQTNNLPTYQQYLNSSPSISNPHDDQVCGRARQYFGFQSNFIDDNAICEDVQQLRFSDDFQVRGGWNCASILHPRHLFLILASVVCSSLMSFSTKVRSSVDGICCSGFL